MSRARQTSDDGQMEWEECDVPIDHSTPDVFTIKLTKDDLKAIKNGFAYYLYPTKDIELRIQLDEETPDDSEESTY